MIKRLTILKREYLERGKKGFFKPCVEYIKLYNATDKKIQKELEGANSGKQTRLFEIYRDFKFVNDKQKAEFVKFAAENYKDYSLNWFYFDICKNGLDYFLNKEV